LLAELSDRAMPGYSALLKDCGFLSATPPCLVVPYEGIGLVCLGGVRNLDVRRDLKFDRSSLDVSVVSAKAAPMQLMIYSENFPQSVRSQILVLTGEIQILTQFGSTVLAVEGSFAGSSASLDYAGPKGRARLDVVTVKRRRIAVSFRYIRYRDESGAMRGGTSRDPAEAEKLLAVMNRLFMPSANIEFTFRSAKAEQLEQALGPAILTENFQKHILPLRDRSADITVFFVGKWKGTDDPLGTAFPEEKSVVVDDAPLQYIAPETAWPPHLFTDDQIYHSRNRAATDRDLHIVLAHELAHILGYTGRHDYSGHDNLMSMNRQDLKLTKDIVLAIGGK
jgi:hypothetical protein